MYDSGFKMMLKWLTAKAYPGRKTNWQKHFPVEHYKVPVPKSLENELFLKLADMVTFSTNTLSKVKNCKCVFHFQTILENNVDVFKLPHIVL